MAAKARSRRAAATGLTLSRALTARGVDHLLLDGASQGANTSRAAVIHARTLEVLDELGVSGNLVSRGVVVPRFTVRDRDRALFHVPFGGLPTKFPYSLMLPQNETEQILAENLTVHWQHRVTGIDGDKNTGIQDAVALARALSGGDLDAYEASRRPVAAGVVAMTDRMTRAATVHNPVARAARNAVLRVAGRSRFLQRKLAMTLSELST